jgi:hypothetical protein
MRPDMKKVVTERYRDGGGIKQPKGEKRRLQKEGLDCDKRQKLRLRWKLAQCSKEFTDVLGPLYGYLIKQIGRPWNDVYSEVVANLPKGTVTNDHIYTHLWQFVEKDVQMIDGRPYEKQVNRYSGGIQPITSSTVGRHPIHAHSNVFYFKLADGHWYEVLTKPHRVDVVLGIRIDHHIPDDVLGLHHNDQAALRRMYAGCSMVAVSKRLLTKKEIRSANLNPLPAPNIVR